MPTKVTQRVEYATLARLLVAAREKAGLSQSEVARRVGRRQAYIWKLENAQQSPDVVELMDLARAIGADAAVLVRDLQGSSGTSEPNGKP